MKTKLFRVRHIMSNLCVFARSNRRAAELFVKEWEHRFGNAPGAFAIEELVRFKGEGKFSRRTLVLMESGAEGIAFYSDLVGWSVFKVGESRDNSPFRL